MTTIDGGGTADTPGRVETAPPEIGVEQSADLQSSRIPPLDPLPDLDPIPDLEPVPDLDPLPDLDPVAVPELNPVLDLEQVSSSEFAPEPESPHEPESRPGPDPTAPPAGDAAPSSADPHGQGPLVSDTRDGPLTQTDTLHDKALTFLSDPDRAQVAVDAGNVLLEVTGPQGAQIPADQAAGQVAHLAGRLQAHLDHDDPSPIS